MDLTDGDWAPTGRFTWSRARAWNNSPCMELINEAFALKEQWPYLQAGFFNGSFEKFQSVSEKNKDSYFLMFERPIQLSAVVCNPMRRFGIYCLFFDITNLKF